MPFVTLLSVTTYVTRRFFVVWGVLSPGVAPEELTCLFLTGAEPWVRNSKLLFSIPLSNPSTFCETQLVDH